MTKNTAKVTLPKDVADAINNARRNGLNNRGIVSMVNGAIKADADAQVIREYVAHSSENYDKLLSALVNGYEVEKSPEEKLKATYKAFEESYKTARSYQHRAEYGGITLGIETALNTLGITIEGINDKEAK